MQPHDSGAESTYEAYRGLRGRASTLGRVLRTAGDPELRSAAARYLPGVGRFTRFARGAVFKAGGPALAVVGGIFAYQVNRAEGQTAEEVGVRAGLEVIGGGFGAYAAGAVACGVAAVATTPVGGAVCVGAVLVGGIVGGVVGDEIGGFLFEDVPRAYEATKHFLGRAVDVLSFWN